MAHPGIIGILQELLDDAGVRCRLSLQDGIPEIHYDKEATDEEKAQGDALVAAFDFNALPADPNRFLKQIIMDDAIPASIYPYIPILRAIAHSPETLKVAWAKIEQTLGIALNQEAKDAIEAHAASADMPVK